MKTKKFAKDLPRFFLEHVNVDSAGCWIWNGPVNEFGWPVVEIEGKHRLTANIIYEWRYGPIWEGKELMPDCGMEKCVNPDHMFLVPDGCQRPTGETKSDYYVVEHPTIPSARIETYRGEYGSCIAFVADNYSNDEVLELSVTIKRCTE